MLPFLMVGNPAQAPGVVIHPKSTVFVGEVAWEQRQSTAGCVEGSRTPRLGLQQPDCLVLEACPCSTKQ